MDSIGISQLEDRKKELLEELAKGRVQVQAYERQLHNIEGAIALCDELLTGLDRLEDVEDKPGLKLASEDLNN